MKGGSRAYRYLWDYNSDNENGRCKHPEAWTHSPKAQRKAVRRDREPGRPSAKTHSHHGAGPRSLDPIWKVSPRRIIVVSKWHSHLPQNFLADALMGRGKENQYLLSTSDLMDYITEVSGIKSDLSALWPMKLNWREIHLTCSYRQFSWRAPLGFNLPTQSYRPASWRARTCLVSWQAEGQEHFLMTAQERRSFRVAQILTWAPSLLGGSEWVRGKDGWLEVAPSEMFYGNLRIWAVAPLITTHYPPPEPLTRTWGVWGSLYLEWCLSRFHLDLKGQGTSTDRPYVCQVISPF